MADPINSGETWGAIRAKINTLMTEVLAVAASLAGKLNASSNLSDLANKAAARTALELGGMAQQAPSAVAISGGTIAGLSAPLAVASGGTGGATQDAAQTGLGGTTVGKALFVAASQDAGQTALGASATGKAVLIAANPGAARTALEVAAAADSLLKAGDLAGLANIETAMGNLGFSAFVKGIRAAVDQAAFLAAIAAQPLAVNLSEIAPLSFARGDLVRRGALALERLTPTGPGQKAFFDGTDVVFGQDEYFYRSNAARVGANATGNQSILGVGVTVEAGSVYEYELFYAAVKTSSATAHDFTSGFGGTAVIGPTMRQALIRIQASGDTTFLSSLTSLAMATLGNPTSATVVVGVRERGTFSVTTGGTLIPNYALSVAPGAAYQIRAGAFMRLRKIGASGADVSFGPWA